MIKQTPCNITYAVRILGLLLGVSTLSFAQTAEVLCKIADNVIEQTVFELPVTADSPQPGRFNAWEYQNYMILEGMNSLHQATGNEKYGSYAARNIDFFVSFQQKFGDTMQSTSAGLKKWYSEPKAMWQCGMIAAFPERQKLNPNKELERGMATFDAFLEKAPKLADGTLARWKPNSLGLGVQIDDLYMVVPYWCRKSKWLGNTGCLERAITESLNYHTYLWNKDDRLMKCLWLNKNKSTYGLYWGRGNAWYVMALTDLLTFIPADHPKRAAVLDNYRSFIQGIVARQDADGLWHQLLDRPDSFSESSCSGMFTYCILKGVNEGWLDPRLLEAGNKGWAGLLTKVTASFQITDVCPGTDISEDPDYYLKRRVTNDQHAIGPFLLAGAEYLKANKLSHGTR